VRIGLCEDFYWVRYGFIAYVFELHFTGGALGQDRIDIRFFESFFNVGGDSGAKLVVFLLHTEGSGDAAAACLDVDYLGFAHSSEQLYSRPAVADGAEMAG